MTVMEAQYRMEAEQIARGAEGDIRDEIYKLIIADFFGSQHNRFDDIFNPVDPNDPVYCSIDDLPF